MSRKVVDFIDSFTDRRICGVSLTKFTRSSIPGATVAQATPYLVLDEIFRGGVEITDSDSVIDCGCGKGRALAYMLKKKKTCKISGVELSKDAAQVAMNWTKKYSNVHVISGNAFDLNYNDYTVLFMARQFEDNEVFNSFIDLIEKSLTHPLRCYFWVEQYTCHSLDNRTGWTLIERKDLLFVKGFFVTITPQRYSTWIYTPNK